MSPEVEEVSLDGPELPELLWLPELPLELLLSSLEESGVLLELVAVFFAFLEELFWKSSQLSLSDSLEAAVWRSDAVYRPGTVCVYIVAVRRRGGG